MSGDPIVLSTSQSAWSAFSKKVDADKNGSVTVDEVRSFITANTKSGIKTDEYVDEKEAAEALKLFHAMGISTVDADRLTEAAQTVFEPQIVTFDDVSVKRAPTKDDFTQFEGDRSGESFFVRGKQFQVRAGGEIQGIRFVPGEGWKDSPVPEKDAKEIAKALRELIDSGTDKLNGQEVDFLMHFVAKYDPK
jgi:hypothetical protein